MRICSMTIEEPINQQGFKPSVAISAATNGHPGA